MAARALGSPRKEFISTRRMQLRSDVVFSSTRLDFCYPSKSRDTAVYDLYNDRGTMLPHLRILCPISEEDMLSRREKHRQEAAKLESMFLDVVDRNTGELVGTSGFRVVDKKASSAEWGIVVRKSWQRRGICQESFDANLKYAVFELSIQTITASTLADNVAMLAFLSKVGMKRNGAHLDKDNNNWLEFKLDTFENEC